MMCGWMGSASCYCWWTTSVNDCNQITILISETCYNTNIVSIINYLTVVTYVAVFVMCMCVH